jgi:hypothetical protein
MSSENDESFKVHQNLSIVGKYDLDDEEETPRK